MKDPIALVKLRTLFGIKHMLQSVYNPKGTDRLKGLRTVSLPSITYIGKHGDLPKLEGKNGENTVCFCTKTL